MCNNAQDRENIRNYLLPKEYTLVVESDLKKYFAKFANKEEKEAWREWNK